MPVELGLSLAQTGLPVVLGLIAFGILVYLVLHRRSRMPAPPPTPRVRSWDWPLDEAAKQRLAERARNLDDPGTFRHHLDTERTS